MLRDRKKQRGHQHSLLYSEESFSCAMRESTLWSEEYQQRLSDQGDVPELMKKEESSDERTLEKTQLHEDNTLEITAFLQKVEQNVLSKYRTSAMLYKLINIRESHQKVKSTTRGSHHKMMVLQD